MSDAAAIETEASKPAGGVPVLTDFKDWLGPMLVKELRQGLRTRVFVVAFILMQAAMVLVMLAAADSPSPGRSSFGFWVVVTLVLLIAMPLRGFSALANEMRMKTLDLLTLTRLSSFRITFGKWAALYSQTLLLAVALLPYVVMRYFLGGVDIANELIALFFLTLLSGALTACTVGFSAHESVILRALVALGVIFVGGMMAGEGLQELFFRSSYSLASLDWFWWAMLGMTLFLGFLCYYLLDMGATQFAPAAENHATRKRIAALCFGLVITAVAGISSDREVPGMLFAMLLPVFGVVAIDALTERPAPVPSVYEPFVRRGFIGKALGRVFYPGWHSGLVFFLILALMLVCYLALFDDTFRFDDEEFGIFFAVLNTVLFPILIIRLFFKDHPSPFVLYVMIQAITIILTAIFAGIAEGEGMLWLAVPIPFAQIILCSENDVGYALPLLFLVGYFMILLVMSARDFGQLRALEARAKDIVQAKASTPQVPADSEA